MSCYIGMETTGHMSLGMETTGHMSLGMETTGHMSLKEWKLLVTCP